MDEEFRLLDRREGLVLFLLDVTIPFGGRTTVNVFTIKQNNNVLMLC
jgi:hypothetical protein